MKNIYLDNAASTPILSEVIDAMHKSMQSVFGNPSSVHNYGRRAKSVVETARKNIAKHFNITPGELIFTASGTEANNMILRNAVLHLGIKTVITSIVEHHAILHTLEALKSEFAIKVKWVNIEDDGSIDMASLETLLQNSDTKTLVSLMHVNNETGCLLDLQKTGELCRKYKVLFHSDSVQGVAHFRMDLQKIPIDFIAASAHKFHGPKGVGFAYFRKGNAVYPILYGGSQERGTRAGTENIHSIVGMEKALQIAYDHLEEDIKYVWELKSYFIDEIKKIVPDICFNSHSDKPEKSSYIILSLRFPKSMPTLLFQLDIKGIAVSSGSACQSGSNQGSHVLEAFLTKEELQKTTMRISFSKLNTREEIDYFMDVLQKNL